MVFAVCQRGRPIKLSGHARPVKVQECLHSVCVSLCTATGGSSITPEMHQERSPQAQPIYFGSGVQFRLSEPLPHLDVGCRHSVAGRLRGTCILLIRCRHRDDNLYLIWLFDRASSAPRPYTSSSPLSRLSASSMPRSWFHSDLGRGSCAARTRKQGGRRRTSSSWWRIS